MGKVSYTVDLEVPVEKCYSNIKSCLADERFKKVCSDLVSPKYIPVIVDETKNEKISIKEIAFDPITGLTIKSISMTHNYSFEPISENETRIKISIEYSLLVALSGFGTVKALAKDKIIGIVNSLISYENGIIDDTNLA